jgi:hypothetical protein
MTRYQLPDIGEGKWIYRGKRYCAFELADGQNFLGMTHEFGEYVVYDKLDECVLGMIKKEGKKFGATLVVSSQCFCLTKTLKEAVSVVPAMADLYFKSVC